MKNLHGKTITCKQNASREEELTLNKDYSVQGSYDKFVLVKNDKGEVKEYRKDRFNLGN